MDMRGGCEGRALQEDGAAVERRGAAPGLQRGGDELKEIPALDAVPMVMVQRRPECDRIAFPRKLEAKEASK
jgi:hypothetical protein